jgi:hypothetical protein
MLAINHHYVFRTNLQKLADAVDASSFAGSARLAGPGID